MKSIIVGMGIGQLYKAVLARLGHNVVTVDLNPSLGATHQHLQDAVKDQVHYDTAHICTPNMLHLNHTQAVGQHSDIVFVEKPGYASAAEYQQIYTGLRKDTNTRLMMVKNNQWRNNISDMRRLAAVSTNIKIHWINRNRVPSPGSWFTDRDKSFGGVSRDLLPHLLSLFIAVDPNWQDSRLDWHALHQRYTMSDFTDTDYGKVVADGVYNVDDRVELRLLCSNKVYSLVADWRSNSEDDIAIYFDNIRIPLGLCPESAYESMISHALFNIDNDAFWQDQYRQDLWIHNIIDTLCK